MINASKECGRGGSGHREGRIKDNLVRSLDNSLFSYGVHFVSASDTYL